MIRTLHNMRERLFRARFCRDCVSRGMAAVIARPAPKVRTHADEACLHLRQTPKRPEHKVGTQQVLKGLGMLRVPKKEPNLRCYGYREVSVTIMCNPELVRFETDRAKRAR